MMRIAQLSERSGVPVPTIKFYAREGLLPAGERTRHNQVAYDEHHVRRLRLIRALIDVGGLTVAAAKQVVDEVESPDRDTHGVLGVIHRSVLGRRASLSDEQRCGAAAEIDALIERRGWLLSPEAPARDAAIEAIATMRQLDVPRSGDLLDQYAHAVERIAAAELDVTATRAQLGRHLMAERTVIGIVLGGALIIALRGLAHEDASARRFPR